MDDIHITLSYKGKKFVAQCHFNIVKMTTTIQDSDFEAFCRKLEEELRSTQKKVKPLPGQSSNSTAKFDPSSVRIRHDDKFSMDHTHRSRIQVLIYKFLEEKVESAALFAETQHPTEYEED